MRRYRISDVARIAGVSVKTLRHYDAIGLLSPAARTGSNYRLYDDAALLRLQQIMVGRALGLSLEDIQRSLDEDGFDLRAALVRQRETLRQRAEDAARMVQAIDRALAALDDEEGEVDMKEIFDGFDPALHEDEAKQRWGHTDAYAASVKRTKSYTKADWARFEREQAAIYADAARAKEAGQRPDDAAVMDIAERARLAIDAWFYPCSHAMHRGLADLYESDPRFAANIDKAGEGLTAFLSAAIRANAARHEERRT